MKYTAIALEFLGFMIAGYAGYLYLGDAETPSERDGPSLTSLGLILGFAIALMLGGAAMLAFGGKGYSVSHGTFWRRNRELKAARRE